jgi:hypothetical protein
MTMRLHAFAFFVVLSFSSAQDCFDDATLNFENLLFVLIASANAGEQAAGHSSEAVDDYKDKEQLIKDSISSNNLSRAENMDFSQVDRLIQIDPHSERFYLQKAAMSVAAGKADAEVSKFRGQGFDAVLNSKEPERVNEHYVYNYMANLATVQSALPPNTPAWQRTQDELCAQVRRYRQIPNTTLFVTGNRYTNEYEYDTMIRRQASASSCG